jgi:hypothetical protein
MNHIQRLGARELVKASMSSRLAAAKCIYPFTVCALRLAGKGTPRAEGMFDRGSVSCRTISRFDLGTACRHMSDS